MTSALIIVDLQNDFIDGSLAVADGEQAAARIANLVQGKPPYDVIVTTQDWHIDPGPHFSDTPDFTNTWPVHCKAGTRGAELSPRLDPILGRIDARFYKGELNAAYSGFEGVNGTTPDSHLGLAAWLREHAITEVDVVGIATDYCVKATALDAVKEGLKTAVLLPYTATVDGLAGGSGEQALIEMRKAGVEIAIPTP